MLHELSIRRKSVKRFDVQKVGEKEKTGPKTMFVVGFVPCLCVMVPLDTSYKTHKEEMVIESC